MILFLTSSPCLFNHAPATLNPVNGYVDRLRASLPERPRTLFICADPDSHGRTDGFARDFDGAFSDAGLPFSEYAVLDGRNADDAEELIAWSDFIILSGGHVPTQNAFFQNIGLREKMADYPGVVMGISAGSMNCADTVYAQPEESGESIDPDYEKFLPGLALTDINILPHYQQVKDNILDGKRLFEDITYGDSHGQVFYVFPDGTYLYQDETECAIYGEAWRLSDGLLEKLTEEGSQCPLA